MTLQQHLVHAWRSVSRRRGASLAAVGVLGLGLGLAAAIFAVVDPYLVKPLPYPADGELVTVTVGVRQFGFTAPTSLDLNDLPTLRDLQARRGVFKSVSLCRLGPVLRVATKNGTIVLQSAEVSAEFFQTLGLATPEGDHWRVPQAGILPLALTRSGVRRVGHDVTAGASLPLHEGGVAKIAAVLPDAFVFPSRNALPRVDVLIPTFTEALVEVQENADGTAIASSPFLVIARTERGVPLSAVAAAVHHGSGARRGIEIDVRSLRSYVTGRLRSLSAGALAASAMVLLLCAANVGNLLLTRSRHRRLELTTREALGAARTDIFKLIAAEVLIVTGGGVVCGLLICAGVLSVAAVNLPADFVQLGAPSVTLRVVAFAAVAGTAVFLVALVPALMGCRSSVRAFAMDAAVTDVFSARTLRLVMSFGQSALAMILVAGASLLSRSFLTLHTQETGLSGDVTVVTALYAPEHVGAMLQGDIDRALARLRQVPGVERAAASFGPMIDRGRTLTVVRIEGRRAPATLRRVTTEYFEATGNSILRGVSLQMADPHDSVIINEAFARLYFDRQQPVGRTLIRDRPLRIVGVVRDSFDIALNVTPEPTVFLPLIEPGAGCVGACESRVNYFVRTTGNASSRAAMERVVTEGVADVTILESSTIRERLAASVAEQSFATLVLVFFAVAGLGVSAFGLASMVAYVVARRTREIAVRICLGALPSSVLWLVVREAAVCAAAGLICGVLLTRALSSVLERFLYGITPGDASTLAVAAAVMWLLACIAAFVPAQRALTVSPSLALKAE
jgi:predicted permease